jgi:hypothetical protein
VEFVEGYLSHKWNIELEDTDHPHVSPDSINNTVPYWKVVSGTWHHDSLKDGILHDSSGGNISIKQEIETLLPNEIYDIHIERADQETDVAVNVNMSHEVKWLDDGSGSIKGVVPYNTTVRFQVVENEPPPTSIKVEINNNSKVKITAVSMIHKKIANGRVTVSKDNTIEKSNEGDKWDAGASSIEYINGQGKGYVQFQINQINKDLKIGLTDFDKDFVTVEPYGLFFTGTSVQIDGNTKEYYVSGDWFRIRYDSTITGNEIQYQKKNSQTLTYETFFTEGISTIVGKQDLYLDISFKDMGGKINEVSMITSL